VAIGDLVCDLAAVAADGLLDVPDSGADLDALLTAGPGAWTSLRTGLTDLLTDDRARARVEPHLLPGGTCRPRLPFTVADFVDGYASLEHATNLGHILRPDQQALLPNWRHLPVAYHGRAGSVVVSGTPVRRPSGQLRMSAGQVRFGPSERLDFELEVGFVVGVASEPGRPLTPAEAVGHLFGLVLLDDWSARDIQAWEYQPLGPYLGKSFATSIAAWVTPMAALEGCWVDGPPQEPAPLPHLAVSEPSGLDIELDVTLGAAGTETVLTRTNVRHLYWRIGQQLAHATSNGAGLRRGDVFATGTVSGSTVGSEGSLMELSWGGTRSVALADGTERRFLADGDEVTLGGRVRAGDVSFRLPSCRGRVEPARTVT
jgi:fumarylacetoacetase